MRGIEIVAENYRFPVKKVGNKGIISRTARKNLV